MAADAANNQSGFGVKEDDFWSGKAGRVAVFPFQVGGFEQAR